MQNEGKRYDINTIVKLYAPKEVGVTLVPLEKVELAESSWRWAQVFGGIFWTLLGALISLVAVKYENNPVTILLVIFVVIFCAMYAIFSQKGIKELRKAREAAVGTGSGEHGITAEELVRGAEIIKGILDKGVFKGEEVLPLSEFETTISVLLPGYSRGVLTKFCTDGLVSIENAASGRPMVKYNKNFDPQTLRGQPHQDRTK
jgi:uncharacterized protein YpmB